MKQTAEKLIQVKYKEAPFGTIGVMCVLSLVCIAILIRNGILRDGSDNIAQIAYIFCLVFLTVLSGYMSIKKQTAGVMRFFMLFLINLYIAVFFSALLNSVYGIPQYAHQLAVFSTLSFFFTMLCFLTLWLYLKQFFEESAITHIVTTFISAAIAIYSGALILNFHRPVVFLVTGNGVYSADVPDYISGIIDFFCIFSLCAATLFSKWSRTRKLGFLCCVLYPLLFSVLSMNLYVSNNGVSILGILNIVVILPICLIFFNANDELEKDLLRREKQQTELQVSAMISQMQPHFLYNSLAVIAALCEEDPTLAAKATNAFADYLRENISFANKNVSISFSEELSHIKIYVWLEKLRFPNKLNIEYDIKCEEFPVPALSVQPMVENAIKHGICKTKEGGTVRISSFDTNEYYTVTVSDNGAGFDVSHASFDNREHLGIENTRYRIREMVGGSLDIVSAPGKGTTVTIRIPK